MVTVVGAPVAAAVEAQSRHDGQSGHQRCHCTVQRVGRSLGENGYVFIAAALRGSDFFGKTGGVQHLSGGGDQDHLEAAVGTPEACAPALPIT